MMQDALTLYKLIILYMLNRVAFPLTKAQVADFILDREYTSFITLQQAVAELADASLISARPLHNRTQLTITESGKETLHFFEGRISHAIKEDVDDYLRKNELRLRDEVSVQANYYRATTGQYEAEMTAKEKGVTLISIRLSVPLEEMAVSICDNWQKKNQEIYKYLTETLF